MAEKKLVDTTALGTTVRRVREDYIKKISEAGTAPEVDVVTEEELNDMLDEIFGAAEESAEA